MAKYTFNNEPISEDFVIEAAEKNELDILDYVKTKDGLNVVDDDSVKENGVVETDASVTPEKNTASNLDPGSSELQKPDNSKEAIIARRKASSTQSSSDPLDYANYDIGSDSFILPEELDEVIVTAPLSFKQPDFFAKKADIKENKKQKIADAYEVKMFDAIKNYNPEEADAIAAEKYFKLGNIPTEFVQGGVPGTQSGGGQQRPIMSQEQYLIKRGKEDGIDYLQQYKNFKEGKGLVGVNPGNQKYINTLNEEAVFDLQDSISENFMRQVDPVYQARMSSFGSDKQFESLEQASDYLKGEAKILTTESLRIKNARDQYEIETKPYEDKLKEINKKRKELEQTVGFQRLDDGVYLPAKAKIIEEYNALGKEHNDLINELETKKFDEIYSNIISDSEAYNFNIKKFNEKIGDLNVANIMEKAISLDYSFVTRASLNMENFFGGGGAYLGSMLAQGGSSFVKALVDDPRFSKKVDQAMSVMKESAINYNQQISDRLENTIPKTLELSDIGSEGVGWWDRTKEGLANNMPSLVISLATAGGGVAGNVAIQGAKNMGYKAMRNAAIKSKIFMKAGIRTSQITFGAGGTGMKGAELELGERNAQKQIDLLEQQFEMSRDPGQRNALAARISEIDATQNYTRLQKAFTAWGYGISDVVGESFGSLKIVAGLTKYSKMIGANLAKKLYYGAAQPLVKGVVIEGTEETLVNTANRIFDIHVLKEDKNMLDGLNKDFYFDTSIMAIALGGGRVAGNTTNILKNEFITSREVMQNQKFAKELIGINENISGLKGEELKIARLRKVELIRKLALSDALSFQKLNSMSEAQIYEAAELSRQKRQVLKDLGALGASGDLSDFGIKTKNDLIKKYKKLDKARNDLLNTKQLRRRNDLKDAGATLKDANGNVETNPEAEYYAGLASLYQDATMVGMNKNGEYIVIENGKIRPDQISKYSKEEQKEINEKFEGKFDDDGVMIKAPANAVRIGDDILVNKQQIDRSILISNTNAEAKYAAVAPYHELFHQKISASDLLNENGDLNETATKAVNKTIESLKNKYELGEISKEDYDALTNRLNNYKKGNKAAEEMLNTLSDAVALGVIKVGDIDILFDMKKVISGLGQKLMGKNDWLFDFDSSDSVFQFLKKFNQDVIAKTSLNLIPEEEQDQAIQESIGSQLEAAMGENMTQEKYDKTGARNVEIEILTTNVLDGIIKKELQKNGVDVNDPNAKFYNQPISDFIEDVKSSKELQNTIKRYKVGVGTIGGFIVSELKNFRIGDISNKYRAGTTVSLDNVTSTGATIGSNIASQDVGQDDALDVVDAIPQSKIKENAPELIDKTIEDDIRASVLEVAKSVLPDVNSKEFLPFVKEVISGKLTNKFKNKFGTRNEYDNFIKKIIPTLRRVMPVSYFKQIESDLKPEDRKFTKPPVRLTKQKDIDKARENEQINYLENDAQGINLYELKKFSDTELANFFNPPPINPDTGKISNTKGNRKTALATAIATEAAFDMIPSVFKGEINEKELAIINKKIQRDSRAQFSEGVNVFIKNDLLQDTEFDFAKNDKLWNKISNIVNIKKFDLGKEADRELVKKALVDNGITLQIPRSVFKSLTGSSESVDLDLGEGAIQPTNDFTEAKAKEPVEIRDYSKNLLFLNNTDFERWAKDVEFAPENDMWNDMAKSFNPKTKKFNIEVALNDADFIKSQDNSLKGLETLSFIFQNLMKGEGLKKNGPLIVAMLGSTSANQQQFIRKAAPFRFFQQGFLDFETVEEHTLPASIVAKYIFLQAATQNLKNTWKNIERNYKQGVLLKSSDKKLKGIGANGKPFTYISQTPGGWVMEDDSWGRYFNINVAGNNFGIDPKTIMLGKGKSLYDVYGINSAGIQVPIKDRKKFKQQQKAASIKNRGVIPINQRPKVNSANNVVLEKMQDLDIQAKNARVQASEGVNLNEQFNVIIEKATGIGKEKRYGQTKARAVGADKGRFDLLGIPPSAQDFVGLTRYFAGKGKQGDKTIAWIKENFIDPFARANIDISNARVALANDFKALKKLLGVSPKDLSKKIVGEPYTVGNAVRVHAWTQQGMKIPGLSKTDAKTLNDYVDADKNLQLFSSELIAINKDNGYPKPGEGWLAGTITTDLLSGLNTVVRAKYLQQWQNNVDQVFTEETMNKLEAAYGSGYRDALENMLGRMKTGSNRGFKGDTLTGRFTDWINGAVGAIMFFNMRSAVLQTISAVNFINFTDNNPLKAAAAFGNQPQYWKDVVKLMNSDYLVERRNGLKINVSEADIAEIAAESKNKAKAFISKILKLGFLPTQIADSFAIASGGATFYRNRFKSLKKQGLSDAEADAQAFQDFRETAEESQQSSRPDRISKQQAGPMGRIILAFANTPAQYARLMQKAASDLKNRRGDDKTNISKILYYGFIQNVIFNALQQALFAMAFADEEPDEEKLNKKYTGIANGMADSLLRGIGFHGAAISTLKNVIMKLADGAKAQDAAIEMLDISPPVSSKIGKLRSAGRTWDWNKKEIMEKGWSLDNPAYLAAGQVVSAATNIPLDRGIRKLTNLKDASDAENEEWMRVANALGWQKWELDWTKDKPKKKSKSRTASRTNSRTNSRSKKRN